MKHKKRVPVTQIGTVSLLMIFIVLCMVIFAVLALSETARDYAFSQKLAEHTTQYYEASGQAEQLLAQIDTRLKNDGILADFSDLTITMEYQEETLLLQYQVDLNDSQALSVVLRIPASDTSRNGSRFDVISWREIQTTQWQGENTLKLIQ
jgi:cell division protein FtsL